MSQRLECVFCQIVSGEAASARVYEDDLVLAFMDIFPVARGHTLVIVKEHVENIFEASGPALIQVMRVTRRLAWAIRQTFRPEGLGVFQLNGAAAGQTIFHYHMHLIPRAPGEAFLLHGRIRASDEELRRQAEKLASALAVVAD